MKSLPAQYRKSVVSLIIAVLPATIILSGCVVASAAKAGMSVGAAAAKTTVGVAGATAGAAGSAATATIKGGDSSKDESEE